MTDERKQKWEDFKQKAKWKAEDVWLWCKHNPAQAAAITVTLIKGGQMMKKSNTKKKQLQEQRELKDCYIYDPRTRHYVKARRPLTNNEWLEFDQRRLTGEPVSMILNDMRLL